MKFKESKYIIIVLSLFLVQLNGFSQLKKANTLYNNFHYAASIDYYKKVLKRDENNKIANQNIAHAYRKLKDYENAEKYYKKITALDPENADNFLYLGQALKNNNNFQEAKTAFEKYLEKNPSSLIGRLMLQSCEEVKKWEAEEKSFEVELVSAINSKGSDFSPVFYNEGIVFVSERSKDLVNDKVSPWSNQPYYGIYYAKLDENNKVAKIKAFSNQLNSTYHDGPVCFTSDNKEVYFTRVSNDAKKGKTNTIKIYKAQLQGKKWKNVTPFKYNSETYSVAHPWVSEDGKKLFFASDMPGGYGGMDLYVSIKEGDEWGKPVNLGKNINTEQNEVFPYYKNGELYFSSDGRPGFGGLDIFVATEKSNFADVQNLKAPLNSNKDDFGIFFTDSLHGYFSSDREGGLGSDDIYKFTKIPPKPKTKVTGIVKYDNLPQDGINISIVDENDVELQKLKTDKDGKFSFEKLGVDENYLIVINEDDNALLENAKIYLTNSKGEKVILLNKLSKGKYTFVALPYDEYDDLPLLEEKDESLFTISVFGQVYETLPGDYTQGMEVWVVDDQGNIIAKTTTDATGKFKFDKLSPDEQYLFMLAEDDDKLNIIILSEDGKVLEAANRLFDGKYKYVRLSSDENVITLINEVDEVIKIAENENFIISNIYYDYDSDEINAAAAKELDKLVLILKKNKHIKVELSSHTDSRASDSYNLNLSQRRAEKAVDYIVSKGIDRSRLIPKGYGETKLVNHCKNNVECSEEEHAKNRRTEFKVIKE